MTEPDLIKDMHYFYASMYGNSHSPLISVSIVG